MGASEAGVLAVEHCVTWPLIGPLLGYLSLIGPLLGYWPLISPMLGYWPLIGPLLGYWPLIGHYAVAVGWWGAKAQLKVGLAEGS